MDLKERVAVVTGAAQGLGRGFAEVLLQNGAQVALMDVNQEAGEKLQDHLNQIYGAEKTTFYRADVTSEPQFRDAFQKVLARFGRVDIFCNNAGVLDEEDWERTMSINLGGVVRGAYLALEHMTKERGGRGGVIVNVASLAGLGPLPSAPIYTASKFGVVGFSRALAATSELGGFGVRVNSLCPTFVRTPLLEGFRSRGQSGRFPALRGVAEALMDRHPPIEVEVVSRAFLHLVQDENLNGAVLAVQDDGAGLVSFPEKIPKTPIDV